MSRPKGFYPVRARGHCVNDTRTDVTMRQHSAIIDEPPSNGGADEGALPLEYLMASFAGCTNVIAHKIAKEMGVTLTDMTVDLDAPLDMSVIAGKSGNPFPEVTLRIRARSSASADQIQALKVALAKRCPVSVLFRRAGCRIVEDWQLEPSR